MEKLINIICGTICVIGFLALISLFYLELTDENVKYDTIITEDIEVTYFDSSIDTLSVERNEIFGYSLIGGDLRTSVDYIDDNKKWWTDYLIKSGVRDYKVIDNLELSN